jgi:hypothetical protein
MLCRITDDPSYDYSDYCEGKGYYAPYEDDHRTEPEELEDSYLYPPMSQQEIDRAVEEVKNRQAKIAYFEKQLRKQFDKGYKNHD